MLNRIIARFLKMFKRERKMKLNDYLDYSLKTGHLPTDAIPFDGRPCSWPTELAQADMYGLETRG